MIAIERCRLSEQCTQRWLSLEAVLGNPYMRYCNSCQSVVHLVEHDHELDELARQGKSVAVLRNDPSGTVDRPNGGRGK